MGSRQDNVLSDDARGTIASFAAVQYHDDIGRKLRREPRGTNHGKAGQGSIRPNKKAKSAAPSWAQGWQKPFANEGIEKNPRIFAIFMDHSSSARQLPS